MAKPERQSQVTRVRGRDGDRGASPTQLLEAERGLRQKLAKQFTGQWIAQNAADLLSEANKQYAEYLANHRPAPNPAGWLVQCAHWRALDQARREKRYSTQPAESVIFDLEDAAPGPEEEVIAGDRRARIIEALAQLDEKDRRLVGLVHGEGHSVTEAGRLLGWGKSTASRHHNDALDALERLLPPRDLLTPKWVGVVAASLASGGPAVVVGGLRNRALAGLQDVSDLVGRALGSASQSAGEVARRVAPSVTEPGGIAASGGAGRLAAQCGTVALAVVCGAVALAPIEHRGVFQVFTQERPARGNDQPGEAGGSSPPIAPTDSPQAVPGTGLSASSTGAAAAARDRRRRRREQIARERRQDRRRVNRLRRLRKNRKDQARARQARAEEREAENEAAAAEEEAVPLEEAAPIEEVAPTEGGGAPPPATGAQVHQEVGH